MSSVWPASSVGDQFEVQLGKMLDAERNAGVRRPYIGNRAVQWGRIEIEAAGLVPLTPTDLRRYRLRAGDLLVCEGGEVGRAAIWADEIPECYFQKALHRLRPRDGYDPRLMLAFLAYWSSNGEFVNYVTQTSIAHLPRDKFIQMILPLPQKPEQRAIADALTDCDRYIDALELLIAKKRDIKQGMMQELLTGRTRLPGFTGEWRKVQLGEVAKIQTGKRNNQDNVPGGLYPFFVRSATVERIDSYSYDCEAILIPGEGGIGSIFHYVNGKFEVHQRVYKINEFSRTCGKFVYFYMSQFFGPHALKGSVKATVDSLRLPTFKSFELRLPARLDEQEAIAAALGDADAEIETLEQRLESARSVKVGMMQELLTGRTRLSVEEDS